MSFAAQGLPQPTNTKARLRLISVSYIIVSVATFNRGNLEQQTYSNNTLSLSNHRFILIENKCIKGYVTSYELWQKQRKKSQRVTVLKSTKSL